MDLYGTEFSSPEFSFNYNYSMLDSLSLPSPYSPWISLPRDDVVLNTQNQTPRQCRHDGKSPLPLGMDWSLPPRKWDGKDSIWPHDPHTGWSYCVTIPSWEMVSKSNGSDPVVFYRVQIGIQSPGGITTTQVISRRFSDFLVLLSELKKVFPKKNLPPAPPKRVLKSKSTAVLEQRRCSLEDWMEKLLSDIDLSRSAPVAIFLELEAAVRSSFLEIYEQNSDTSSSTGVASANLSQQNIDVPAVADSSAASDQGNHSPYGECKIWTSMHRVDDNDLGSKIPPSDTADHRKMHLEGINKFMDRGKSSKTFSSDKSLARDGAELLKSQDGKLDGQVQRLSRETVASITSSMKSFEKLGSDRLTDDGSTFDFSESSEAARNLNTYDCHLQIPRDIQVIISSDVQQKLNRVLDTARQRLATAKTDLEDVIARLNQETALREFLTTKVRDLEVELETTKQNCTENMEQANLAERERFTQMQWDMEELRTKYLEVEMQLKSEQDEKMHAKSEKLAVIQEKKALLQELNAAKEQLLILHKQHEEIEIKSKADVRVLVKEAKSLRSSQLQLKEELSQLKKEKLELERVLEEGKRKMELAHTANAKLLHECGILCNRLQECSISFLIEDEDKFILDDTSPADAIDLLTTSDNRLGLLLAEAQLLAQDVENIASANNGDVGSKRADDELRKMLTDIFVDNARLRKQINSVIRCALKTDAISEKDDEEEISLRRTVLSKLLEK